MAKGSRNVSQGRLANRGDAGANAIEGGLLATETGPGRVGWSCPFFGGILEASLVKVGPSFVLECPISRRGNRRRIAVRRPKNTLPLGRDLKQYDLYQAKN